MSDLLKNIISAQPGFEREIVERYTARLLDFARRRLPDRVRGRIDPEDLVQSVYRSFFHRLNEGRFSFEESGDLWRLLAAMTFHRTTKAVRFHQQHRRDIRREERQRRTAQDLQDSAAPPDVVDRQPGPDDLAALFESLERLLSQLPDKYRDIAVLQLQGLSVEEIAAQVGRSRRTVFRAQKELQELAGKLLETAE